MEFKKLKIEKTTQEHPILLTIVLIFSLSYIKYMKLLWEWLIREIILSNKNKEGLKTTMLLNICTHALKKFYICAVKILTYRFLRSKKINEFI
jgi:hypothetical protein